MNDQNNSNGQEDSVENSEQQIKEVGRDIGREAEKLGKKATREGVRFLAKAIVANPVSYIAIGILLILVILSSFLYEIDDSLFKETSSELTRQTHPEQRRDGKSANDNSANRGGSNDEFIEGKGEAKRLVSIEDRTLLLDTMEYITNISNYVRKSGSSYEDFGLSSDYHELRTYLEAEIVTLFPDVRERDDIKSKKPLEEGELQGCVQFWRKHEDGSKELMEYTPYDEFAEELKELGYDLYTDRFTPIPNATEDYILKKYYKVRDKYTLDENFNIIIPTFSSKKTEVFPSQWYEDEGGINGDGTQPSYIYTIDTKKIDYQTRIVKDRYYFPFEMGVAMLLTTRNPGFCDALAELVKDSEIIIDIQDDLVKEINTRTFNYTANYKIEVTYNVLPPNTSYSPYQWSTTGTYEAEVKPYVTIVETTTTITTKMVFQRVDSWLFHYLYDYVYEPSDPIINEYTSTPYDDADYRGVYNKNENPHRIPIPPCTEPGKNSLDSFYIYEKKTGQYWEYKDERIEAKYIEIEANREGRFAAERFLTLLRVDPTRINEKTGKPEYNLYDRDKNIVIVKHKNKDNFLSSPMDALMGANLETLIYRYLEKNEKTEGFAQIINHLMAIFLGQEEYDPEMFVEYDPGEFDPITGGGRRRPAVDHILVILWKKKYGGH